MAWGEIGHTGKEAGGATLTNIEHWNKDGNGPLTELYLERTAVLPETYRPANLSRAVIAEDQYHW